MFFFELFTFHSQILHHRFQHTQSSFPQPSLPIEQNVPTRINVVNQFVPKPSPPAIQFVPNPSSLASIVPHFTGHTNKGKQVLNKKKGAVNTHLLKKKQTLDAG